MFLSKEQVEELAKICSTLLFAINEADCIDARFAQSLIDDMQDVIEEASNDYWRKIHDSDSF